MRKLILLPGLWILLTILGIDHGFAQPSGAVFLKDNVTPWCIVPFDAKKRTPEERSEMLHRLGFKTLAYDWRDVNIPEFDEEVAALKKHGIRMSAFWWSGGLPSSVEDLNESERMQMQLDFFDRNSLQLDVWITLSDKGLQSEPDEAKYAVLASRVDLLAGALKKRGCRLGLYNHGDWGGQPGNMVGIIRRVKSDNVGIVYNFHHGHEHLDQLPGSFQKMVPWLYAVNLNGMNPGGPKILPLGEGSEDLKILKMIVESGYTGPVGIIGHIETEDVEGVLIRNLEGLKKMLDKLGYADALRSYK